MSKWFAVLMALVLVAIVASAAVAKPITLTDGQLSAIVAGEVADIEHSSGVATVGDNGTAIGELEVKDSLNQQETKIEDSLNTDNSVNTEDSLNTDTEVKVEDSLNKTETEVKVEDSFNKTEDSNNTDKSVDNSVDNSGQDNSTTTVTKMEDSNNTDTEVKVEDSFNKTETEVKVEDSFNKTEDSNNTDKSVDNSVDNSGQDNSTTTVTKTETETKIEDSYNTNNQNHSKNLILMDDAQENARAISLVNSLGGDVAVGSNILVVANQASAAPGGAGGDARTQICSSVLAQLVANFSSVKITLGGGGRDGGGGD